MEREATRTVAVLLRFIYVTPDTLHLLCNDQHVRLYFGVSPHPSLTRCRVYPITKYDLHNTVLRVCLAPSTLSLRCLSTQLTLSRLTGLSSEHASKRECLRYVEMYS